MKNSLYLPLLFSALGASACGSPGTTDEGNASARSFLALERDFANFREWPSIVVGESIDAEGHMTTNRRVYVNAIPEEGATHWPLGTLLVKSGLGNDSGGDREELHAMVKRSIDGTYNSSGAIGWEWMQLVEIKGIPTIAWRGSGPPDGDGSAYGCRPGLPCEGFGNCNTCHAAASRFDYVMSEPLRLPNLAPSLRR